MHFAIVMSPIIAKFCFAVSFVPDIEANFMVTGFTTRDKSTIDGPYSSKPLNDYLFHKIKTTTMTNLITMQNIGT